MILGPVPQPLGPRCTNCPQRGSPSRSGVSFQNSPVTIEQCGCGGGFVPPHNWPFEAKRSDWSDSGGETPACLEILGASKSWKTGTKECDILEDLIPPPESRTCEHLQSRREQGQRQRRAPPAAAPTRPGAWEACGAEGGWPAGPAQPFAPASTLRRAPESCPAPRGPVSEPYPQPSRWEPRASSSNSSGAAPCDAHGLCAPGWKQHGNPCPAQALRMSHLCFPGIPTAGCMPDSRLESVRSCSYKKRRDRPHRSPSTDAKYTEVFTFSKFHTKIQKYLHLCNKGKRFALRHGPALQMAVELAAGPGP